MSPRIPTGDNRIRDYCEACTYIHYENPKLVVGAILEFEGNILLCKRAIEPRLGYWTLPAGFMENGESTQAGALRETFEEAGADAQIEAPFALFDLPHISQVHLFYRGKLRSSDLNPGPESLEAGLFSEATIPWDSLSFESVRQCLKLYLCDRKRGQYPFHSVALEKCSEDDQR